METPDEAPVLPRPVLLVWVLACWVNATRLTCQFVAEEPPLKLFLTALTCFLCITVAVMAEDLAAFQLAALGGAAALASLAALCY
jgi:hypothetical protein